MNKTFKRMMHMALALLLALSLAAPALATEASAPAAEETTAAPVAQITEAPAEAPVETPAPAAEETTAEPTEAPVETPAPITEEELPANARLMAVLQDTLNAQRSVSIYAVYDGEFLSFGDQVTFVALLRGYDNLTYTLQWQWSQDNLIWEDVPGAEQATYSFQVAEDNYQNFWRVGVTITGVIVPDELAAAAQ